MKQLWFLFQSNRYFLLKKFLVKVLFQSSGLKKFQFGYIVIFLDSNAPNMLSHPDNNARRSAVQATCFNMQIGVSMRRVAPGWWIINAQPLSLSLQLTNGHPFPPPPPLQHPRPCAYSTNTLCTSPLNAFAQSLDTRCARRNNLISHSTRPRRKLHIYSRMDREVLAHQILSQRRILFASNLAPSCF